MTEFTQKEFAALVGLTTRQIRNLEVEGLPHRAEKNKKFYPCPDAVTWVREKAVNSALAEAQSTDYDEARTREMAARADKAELEVRRLRGEMIHVQDLEALHAEPLANLRSRLLSLTGRIAGDLPMPTVDAVEIIEPIVHDFMAELSEDDEDDAD